jgi:uncharacterized protein (UPF0276 family)
MLNFESIKKYTPKAGLEWCTSLHGEIMERMDEIPLIEIIPENFFSSMGNAIDRDLFDAINAKDIPVIIHGVGLSIGSLDEFKQKYFEEMLAIVNELPTSISFTEHLCFTEKDGSEIGQLSSMTYDSETLDFVSKKVEQVQKQITIPFALENLCHSFALPGQEMSEVQFFNKLMDRTGCKMLLDLNNIYTNGVNFGIDPYGFLDELNIDGVDSIHLAGGFYDRENFLQDGHCEKVPKAVFELLDYTIRKAGRPIHTIVERTGNNKRFGLQVVLDDQNEAQAVMDNALSGPKHKPLSQEVVA